MRRFLACALLLFLLPLPGLAQSPAGKKPLDHTCYDLWNTLLEPRLSHDGQWALWTLRSGKGEFTLTVRHTTSEQAFTIPKASQARFSADSRFVVYLRGGEKKDDVEKKPDPDELAEPDDQVQEPDPDKTAPPTGPRTLGILDLTTGKTVTVPQVASFRLPEKNAGWLVYLVQPADAAKPEPKPTVKGGKPLPPGKAPSPLSRPGELVLRNLATDAETRHADVVNYALSEDGQRLAFCTSSNDTLKNGVDLLQVANGERLSLARGPGKYQALAFSNRGDRLAFLSTRADVKAKTPAWSVYHWQPKWKEAQALILPGAQELPKGWTVAASRPLSFSDSGARLFFGTAPPPPPDPAKSAAGPSPDKVKVDVWHWKDPHLQTVQLAQLLKEKSRSYLAVAHLDSNKVVQLATREVPDVAAPLHADSEVAVGSAEQPYHQLLSWDYPAYRDVYLIDVQTGGRQRVLTKVQSPVTLSPGGKYLTWWDGGKKAWLGLAVKARQELHLTRLLPRPVHNELHDLPSSPAPYGLGGWVQDDRALLIYDKHDIWATDPQSVLPPVCVTDGKGRAGSLRFRYSKLDPNEKAIAPDQPLLLSAFDLKTKASGIYEDKVSCCELPRKLLWLPEQVDIRAKAKNADKLLVTRSSFNRYPDLWVCDSQMQGLRQLSHANPQQQDYRWGSAELVKWTSLDGDPLQGLLYKPDGFNPKTKYPLLVYFYERSSDGLHKHVVPTPSRSSINIPFYVSRGYVVFVPDISYRVGHPGQSCVNAVLPGITTLMQRGFIDPAKIGVQGHSWGGYQIAYLLTRTKLFTVAVAGAPVSNMTSAYGGIRWTTGMSRMFQYEKSQSRIGGTLWDAQQRYIENSPLFWADRIHTPLVMLHNDKDGAVPWYQGIELFVALRRLERPCWLVNYNGEDHGLLKRENQLDWSIRLQQVFDHYLQGAPAPVWLAEGVPAQRKGKTLGLDLVEPAK